MKWILWGALSASLLLNIVLIILTPGTFDKNDPSKYPYLSKRIFAQGQNEILINFIPLRNALRDYVDKLPDTVGVYFEYLPSGVSIGVNDRQELAIASLIKTPLVMAIYRQIEKGVIKKDDVVTMQEEYIDKGFGNLWQRGVGTELTVSELTKITLEESDNTASKMLGSLIPKEEIRKVFDSLDIPMNTQENDKTITVSPKSYSSILRSLYLSSYLEREHSNEILDILTKTLYDDKIVAGVPSSIKVAHKIGIWDIDSVNGKGVIYNDCGIVYVPDRSYLLCIMTKTDEINAKLYMKTISKMIYSYVSKVR
ncbi:MAG: serine hydrolase [Patescibacteria group bacterium]